MPFWTVCIAALHGEEHRKKKRHKPDGDGDAWKAFITSRFYLPF